LLTSDYDANNKPFLTGERTAEGFYKTKKGMAQAVSRAIAYSYYADTMWCETGTPDLEFAKQFAEAVNKVHPGKMLAYNCSPSFNWKKIWMMQRLQNSNASWVPWVTSTNSSRFQAFTPCGTACLSCHKTMPIAASPLMWKKFKSPNLQRAIVDTPLCRINKKWA